MTCMDDNDSDDSGNDDDDHREAAERVAQARRLGTNIVRSHLQTHLQNNPDSSFVTWIATLHPENASVNIDKRFFIPGNPWQMVYEETIMDQSAAALAEQTETQRGSNTDNQSAQSRLTSESCGPTREVLRHCSPLDLLIGSSLTLLLVTVVVALEITALVFYVFESALSHLMDCLSPPGLATLWLYAIAGLLYQIFAVVDSILLLLSVGISEFIAAIQFSLSLCFGGINFASLWHQSLRRTTHLIRVWFRAPCNNPKRHVFGKNINAIVDWWNQNVQESIDCNSSASAEENQYRALNASASSDEDERPTAIQTAPVYHNL